MLKFFNYDIVFSEIPNEVTLAINISGCPNHCAGCHSPWLWKDEGELLSESALMSLIHEYGDSITCICFMGGDADSKEIERLALYVHSLSHDISVGWYSGRSEIPSGLNISFFQYIKLGGYREDLGGLQSKRTNQRLYKIGKNNEMEDITYYFWGKTIKSE